MTNQTIKVGVLPGQVTEYVIEGTQTVAEVLEMANIDSTGYDIRLDGTNVELTATIPATSQMLILVKKIKGNMYTIKVGVLPGAVQELVVEDDLTVAEVLELAGINADGYDVRLDGETVSLDDDADGQMLVLVKKIKGNK